MRVIIRPTLDPADLPLAIYRYPDGSQHWSRTTDEPPRSDWHSRTFIPHAHVTIDGGPA